MTDRIGVLGEVSGTAVGTLTVYTVPTGKAARGKLMLRGQNAAGAATVEIIINNVTVAKTAALTASHYIWTSTSKMVNTGATAPTGADADNTVAAAPQEYYLSAGDTVQVVIGTAAVNALTAQFVGTEIDV
jgi:hypothetical protein